MPLESKAYDNNSDMLENRLINWANWVKPSRLIPISCESLESNYISPQCWNDIVPRETIDILDAQLLESYIVRLHQLERKAIKLKYISRLPTHWISKRIHADADQVLRDAKARLQTLAG